jgi:hypothetical protein
MAGCTGEFWGSPAASCLCDCFLVEIDAFAGGQLTLGAPLLRFGVPDR